MTGPSEGKPDGQGSSSEHQHALESLLAFNSKIRGAVEVRFNGERIGSVCRKGLASLEPEQETLRVLDQTAIGMGMGASMNGYHGRVRVAIALREKLSIIVFPLFDSLILVSADPEFPLQKIRPMTKLLDTCFPSVPEPEEPVSRESRPPTTRIFRGDLQ